jgi:site-specific DNA-methyltransferase (adenine-specific)
MTNTILHCGDNAAYLKDIPDNTYDSIVCDPPYGIEFLGKEWDSHTGTLELWKECLRVLKPGGYLLAFSAARTYHRLASNVELAGFEIRDQLMWLYSSGFPKAQDIGKGIDKRDDEQTNNWNGWKTQLKPAHEPIVMARKPIKGSVINNVLENGLAALNIDATRIAWAEEDDPEGYEYWLRNTQDKLCTGGPSFGGSQGSRKEKRTEGVFIRSGFRTEDIGTYKVTKVQTEEFTENDIPLGRYPSNVIGEVDGYQKYFYCPKVGREERHIGFDVLPETSGTNNVNFDAMTNLNATMNRSNVGNNHPTIKPVALMEYLIKLVTPPSTDTLQRKVLDPFMGSGSTGMAATALGHHFTGCDLDQNYVNIAKTRIEAWSKRIIEEKKAEEAKLPPKTVFDDLFNYNDNEADI